MITKQKCDEYNETVFKISKTNHVSMGYHINGKIYAASIILNEKTKKKNLDVFELFCHSGIRFLEKKLKDRKD